MLDISHEFVKKYVEKYDRNYKDKYRIIEIEINDFLAKQGKPKYFDKEHFIKLAKWKTPRQEDNYEKNDESLIIEATRLAYETSNSSLKLHILMALKGVGVPVASTLLHFLHPYEFAIFDVRARSSLQKAGKWNRSVNDASSDAWLEYVNIMRDISKAFGVSLRELDKALWAHDKWG
jgi:thermostable 8-oxoguanine DNA glycosylase